MKKKKEIKTWKNLEAAFAGESMAYQKYLYFAKLARQKGNEEVARLFEDTAKQEIGHAAGHLSFLYPADKLSVKDLLTLAAEGETFEYTEMYPGYAETAKTEGQNAILKEFEEQQTESAVHAKDFQKKLEKLSKVFEGLAKVEKKHAAEYTKTLAAL
ncbi:MAG: rubrerythrin [Bdellovibrio sp.]|nr:rubrerythrin [Bdellovibrio sp.]